VNFIFILLCSSAELITFPECAVLMHTEGVANSKIETVRDGETSVFLCETETFEISEMRDRDFRVYRL